MRAKYVRVLCAHVNARHNAERERKRKMHNEIPISSPTCAVEEHGRGKEGRKRGKEVRQGGREGGGGGGGGSEENFARG